MSDFAPEKILDVLSEHRVDFVVIGGYAALLHGARRPTRDVDVTPERSKENLGRLAAALESLDAEIRVDGLEEGLPFSTDATALAGMAMLNLTTRYGDLDISMTPDGTGGYEDLVRGARRVRVGDSAPQVASLDDVIRSKESASRPKDAEALPELRRLAIAVAKVKETRAAFDAPSTGGPSGPAAPSPSRTRLSPGREGPDLSSGR